MARKSLTLIGKAILVLLFCLMLANLVQLVYTYGGPCEVERCDIIAEKECIAQCGAHGGCEEVSGQPGYCYVELCFQKYWLYCNDGTVFRTDCIGSHPDCKFPEPQ